MSARTLNGNSSSSSTSNIYINNMFESGEAVDVTQESLSTKAKVSLSMKKNTDVTTTLNDSDIFLLSDGSTGKVVKYITAGNLKNAGTHWHLETIGVGTNLYPDNTGYNLLVGTETNTGGADQSKWSQFRCDGIAEVTGDLTLGASIKTGTGTLTLPSGDRTLATLDKAETFTNKTLTLPKISESSGTETYTIAGGSISGDRTITLPDLVGNDTMVCAGNTQAITSKTLDSTNNLNSCLFDELRIKGTGLGASYKYTLSAGAILADRTLNIPATIGTDTLVTTTLTQAISNKTFSSCTYTAPVFDSLILNDASGGSTTTITITAEESANNQTLTIPPLQGNVRLVVGEASVRQTITNTTMESAIINDPTIKRPSILDADFSHSFRILGGGLSADKDVTIPAVADNTEEFVMTKVSQSLTNKALVSPFLTTPIINDLSSAKEYRITAPFNLADNRVINLPQLTQEQDFVFSKHSQTLESKTLKDPIMNLGSVTGSTGQVIASNGSGGIQWSSAGAQWTLSSSTLSPSNGTSTNVKIGPISGTPVATRLQVNGDSTFQGYIAGGAIVSTQNSGFWITNNADFNITSANTWYIFMGGTGDLHFQFGTSLSTVLKGYVGTSASSGSYKQMNFTGQHRCITENQSILDNIDDYIGLVVISTGTYNSIIPDDTENDPSTDVIDVNDAQPIVELSNKVRDKRVYGVISNVETKDTERKYGAGIFMSVVNKKIEKQRLFINSVGEGGMKVCNENGNISNGDLLTTSSKEGLAMKQSDGIVKNYTIGKSTQDYIFTSDTDYKLIGVVYYCG